MVGPQGWARIGPHGRIRDWAEAALPLARSALRQSAEPLRCGGTWAVGLDLLANGADGGIGGVPLPWDLFGLRPEPLHRAQLSAVYPGYPRPSAEETPAALAFRRSRDAAHLDGLLPMGPQRRRMLREPHGWILGLPLTACGPGAAPLVVWEGSQALMGAALRAALLPHLPETWSEVDLTGPYAEARREVFATCRRVEVPAVPGEAILLHRMTLHGVAPWAEGAVAPPEGRIIAYFRPLLPSVEVWARLP